MKQDYWKQFAQSGRVEDYLYYKGMSICQAVMDRYENRNEDKNSESVDHGDRDDPVSITHRRI